jgi:predicted transcriptional regulator of viral defense system
MTNIPGQPDKKYPFQHEVSLFKKHGGMLHTSEVLRVGIHPATLYAMCDARILDRISRGVYRLASSSPLENPDLVTVAMRVKNGVICLLSALAFHDMTTHIPHEIHVALPRGAEEPRLDYPPLRTYRFSGRSFTDGIERHEMDGIWIRVYCPEKTLADCFKFRNKTGLDSALEALRIYCERRKIIVDDIMHYASICRVTNIIRPYLEAILS